MPRWTNRCVPCCVAIPPCIFCQRGNKREHDGENGGHKPNVFECEGYQTEGTVRSPVVGDPGSAEMMFMAMGQPDNSGARTREATLQAHRSIYHKSI